VIFVTVGTQEAPFDRLLRVVERFPHDEEIVVQHGPSTIRPAHATCVQYLPSEAFVDHVRRARVVIASAGVGVTMVCVANGKKPVVVPRLSRLGEHPDDHQHEFARRMERRGLALVVEDPERLPEVVASGETFALPPMRPSPRLVAELREYLQAEVAAE